MLRGLVIAVIASLFVAIAACGEDFEDCYGDDLIACTCAGGAQGYAKCGASGDYRSSACVCDGTTPGIDAGSSNTPDAVACDAACPNGCNPLGECRRQ